MLLAVARCGGSNGNNGSTPADGGGLDSTIQGDGASSDAGPSSDAGASSDAPDSNHDGGTTDALGASDSVAPGDAGPPRGSGKTTYSCPDGGIDVPAGDDVAAVVNGSPANATICVHGPHIATATLVPKMGQTIVGVDATASISGAHVLTGWTAVDGGGAWVNTGSLPATAHVYPALAPGHNACFAVSTYQDDVFYNDQRMMRVLTAAQVTGQDPTLPPGQAVTPAETGRFATDYTSRQITINLDPTNATVELATLDMIVSSTASGITLENLLLEKALTTVVSGGPSWTIQDCTIRFAHNFGVQLGGGTAQQPTVYKGDLITNNGENGIAGTGSFIQLQDTEMSWNNIANYRTLNPGGTTCGGYFAAGANKFVLANQGSAQTPSLAVTGLDSHDNVGNGFWADVYNQYVVITGSHLHDNEGYGTKYEFSCNVEIANDEIDHNGRQIKNTDLQGGGVLVNDINASSIHDNVIHDNVGDAVLLDFTAGGLSCMGAATSGDGGPALVNDVVRNNDIYMCSGVTGCNGSTLAAHMNQFSGNRYHVADATAPMWINGGAPIGWTAWQDAGEDPDGSVGTPCQ
jgi:hypothetical protein